MKQDADVRDQELIGARWLQQGSTVDVHVAYLATFVAHHVMVVINIGIKTRRTNANINELQLSHFGKLIQGLVDGAQRDTRHVRAGQCVQRFCRWMCAVVVHQLKQQLSLRGELASLCPKGRSQFRR